MMTSMSSGSAVSTTAGGDVLLYPGKQWNSFEQLRLEGGSGLSAGVGEGEVGFLSVKGVGFAILRRRDFDRLYGLAQDVHRLAKGIPLLRRAAEFVLRGGGDELAIRHFQELTMTFPNLVTGAARVLGELDLEVDDGAVGASHEISLDSFIPSRAATRPAGETESAPHT